ncbi:GNAT family N-acetyltransferase [Kitasatospora sp. NPDC051853]|uniref:GNAT family N-acetyltransferase n=1 Tax=Kitasatospora sp. NPDC051853 TaxID=3364058 RepID=UPI0037BB461F
MTDTLTFRALRSPDDLPALSALLGLSLPELIDQERQFPASEALVPDAPTGLLAGHGRTQVLALTADGVALGYGTAWRAPWTPPGDVASRLVGGGDAVLDGLAAALEGWARSAGASRLLGEVPDSSPELLRILLRRGHRADAHLRLAEAVLAPEPLPAPPRSDGIRLETLADAPDPSRAAHALHRLYRETLPDNPGFVDALPGFADWRAEVLDGPGCRPDWILLARSGEELAGVTAVQQTGHPGVAHVSYTAVRRPWRGRGLARTLKLTAAHHLALAGVRRLRTEVEGANSPMLAVNSTLGYHPVPGGHHRTVLEL